MKIRATDVVDEERKTLKSAVANLVIDNELPRERIRHWKTGDVVEITEKLGGAILWCLGYGLPDSRPRCANGCAANQCPSATFSTLAGASAAPFLLAKAQKPEQSYSSNSITSPFFFTTTWLSSTAHLPGSRSLISDLLTWVSFICHTRSLEDQAQVGSGVSVAPEGGRIAQGPQGGVEAALRHGVIAHQELFFLFERNQVGRGLEQGYGRKDSIPHSVTGCTANQGGNRGRC